MAALAAGFASCLVLFTPLAAMLPLVAIALAVVALAEIRTSEGHKVGRWPALGGLALAIGFVSQALAMTVVEGLVANQRATATAVAWIDAIREGRLDDAIAVSSPRALIGVGQGRHEGALDSEARREAFQALPAVTAVAGCRKAPPRQIVTERSEDGWVVRFSMETCSTTGTLVLAVAPGLVAVRGHTIEEWRVQGFVIEP